MVIAQNISHPLRWLVTLANVDVAKRFSVTLTSTSIRLARLLVQEAGTFCNSMATGYVRRDHPEPAGWRSRK